MICLKPQKNRSQMMRLKKMTMKRITNTKETINKGIIDTLLKKAIRTQMWTGIINFKEKYWVTKRVKSRKSPLKVKA